MSVTARQHPASVDLPPDHSGGYFDDTRLRRVMAQYCTGVVVVTAMHDASPVGFTCQSFASLSLRPPLVMFAASTASRSWPRIRAAGRFAVNILSDLQEPVSRAFARSGADKFAGVGWCRGRYGSPLIDGVLGHLECGLHAVHRAGDHDIVVGRVFTVDEPTCGDSSALLYFQSRYWCLDAAAETIDAHPHKARRFLSRVERD